MSAPALDRPGSHVAGGPEVDDLLRDAAADRLPGVLVVVGSGGSGKSWLLGRLAEVLRTAGRRTVDGSTPAAAPAGRTVVLVDDAQHLGDDAARRVLALAADPDRCTVVAHRPGPAGPGLRRLLAELPGDRRVVRLGHLERAAVAQWLAAELGPVPDRVLDDVVASAGGLPALVARHVAALERPAGSRHGNVVATIAGGAPGSAGEHGVREHVRAMVAALDEQVTVVLRALAAGAPWDGELIAVLLDREPSAVRVDLERVRATGLVRPDGGLLPLARAVLLAAVPPDLVAEQRRRLVGLVDGRGGDAVPLARLLAADGVRDRRVAELLTTRAAAVLAHDPAQAAGLLADAVATGADRTAVAALRAEAAALGGRVDEALRWADEALRRPTPGGDADLERAAGVSAALLAGRGMPQRSAQLFGRAGAERSGAAALVLLGSGCRAEAEAALAGEGAADQLGALPAGERLMATAVLQSLSPSAAAHGAATALSTLAQAGGLLEPLGAGVVLPDTPAALAALIALHRGDTALAGSVLRRALRAGTGGPLAERRHRLLLGWTAMLDGRLADAEREVDREPDPTGGLSVHEPRDELFRSALRLGLARRRGDLAGLMGSWAAAREAVVRHPLDLFTLLPMGEVVVAAARLRHAEDAAHLQLQARELLDRLGSPPVWAAAWHWCGVQAAILAESPAALEPHATALVAAARTSPVAGVLAGAGRTWLQVLRGEATAEQVVAAAEELGGIGWVWDGSRLAGHAAARARSATDRSVLLQCARALTGPAEAAPVPVAADDAPPSAPGRLSAREREVAELVVAGVTYREIGSRLFISAKTVEHHVARMRQRLAAADRTELLARLKAELGAAG